MNNHEFELIGFHACAGKHRLNNSRSECVISHAWLGVIVDGGKLQTLGSQTGAPHRSWLPPDDTSISVLATSDEQVAWTSQSDRSVLHLRGVAMSLAVRVVAIALGREHAVLIDDSGSVRVRGRNDIGQCGSDVVALFEEWTPLVASFGAASAVACGPNHTLLVSRDSGALWTCGFNLHGECGTGALATSSSLQLIDAVPAAVSVVAGRMHSAVLDRDGQLFTFGLDPFGGCEPTLVASHVRSVVNGARHIAFVTTSGVAMGMGENRFGQLLANDASESFDAPIELRRNVTSVVAFDRTTGFIQTATT